MSLIARQHGLTAAQLFQFRKAYLEGSLVAVGANETVVPASELQEARRRIKQLECALERKTLENVQHTTTEGCALDPRSMLDSSINCGCTG